MLLRIMEGHRRLYPSFLHGTLTALHVERAQISRVLQGIKDCSGLRSNLIPLQQHKFRMPFPAALAKGKFYALFPPLAPSFNFEF